MEQATDLPAFGTWLDQLVQILTAIAHLNGGVFDKFTGDGALVHFLKGECEEVYEKLVSVDAAMRCAIDMHRGLQIHLEHLMPLLHYLSRKIGAGIAIAVGDAFWSFDYRDNPLTVGQSVVRACRVCDKAPPGTVRVTNGTYVRLSDDIRRRIGGWRMVDFESKEIDQKMEVTVWECDVSAITAADDPGHPSEEIAKLCAAIYTRSGRRPSRQVRPASPMEKREP
jgi:class 3 adenylate cyclase